MADQEDSVLRAMTNDGGFRVITARTTETVKRVVSAQRARGHTAAALGQLVTGVLLFRETMSPRFRAQAILRDADRRVALVADSRPGGGTRGLCQVKKKGDSLYLGHGSTLEMMRTLPNGQLHRGLVEVPQSGSISDALMVYMQSSEQILSMISVGCHTKGSEIVAAGGYIVQLLPELQEEHLMVMTERLEDFKHVDELFDTIANTPTTLMDELLYGMEFSKLEETPVRFACDCSQVRVMSTLASLDREEVGKLVKAQENIDLSCDYCGEVYRVRPAQLKGLLSAS